ncbi:MAG: MTH1187 family thiamine-binding protein [bacterium]
MSILVNFAMFPTDKGDSVSPYVSRILDMIRSSGVNYKLTPMSTVIETKTLPEALEIIQKAYDLLAPDCNRVYSSITMDIQTNKPMGRMEGKVKSIESKIGEVKK